MQACALQQLVQAVLHAGGGVQARAAQTFHQPRFDGQGDTRLAGELGEDAAQVTGWYLKGTALLRGLPGGLRPNCRQAAT
ncbi:hypothetical protein D3C79_778690 [compost metagenome]